MIVLKFILLVIAIWFSLVNFMLYHRKQGIPTINFIVQAAAIAGLTACYGIL